MAREQPTTVYTEVQIDEDSISLTLISESGSSGPVIEDTERYTFDELQSLSGEHSTLRLSRESVNALKTEEKAVLDGDLLAELEEGDDLPEVGDCLHDQNPPWWSEQRLEVVEVLEHVTCDEYVIQGRHEGQALDTSLQSWNDKTVADANPGYDKDEPVVIAQYDGTGGTYAFPASRLA